MIDAVLALIAQAFLLSIIHAAFVVIGLQGLTKQSDGLSAEYLREILTLVNDSRATMNNTAAATLEPALVALEGLLVELGHRLDRRGPGGLRQSHCSSAPRTSGFAPRG